MKVGNVFLSPGSRPTTRSKWLLPKPSKETSMNPKIIIIAAALLLSGCSYTKTQFLTEGTDKYEEVEEGVRGFEFIKDWRTVTNKKNGVVTRVVHCYEDPSSITEYCKVL